MTGGGQVRRLRANRAMFKHRMDQAGKSGRTLRERMRAVPRSVLVAAGVGLGLVAARLPARAVLAVTGGLLTIALRLLSAPLIGPVALGAIMARRKKHEPAHDAVDDARSDDRAT